MSEHKPHLHVSNYKSDHPYRSKQTARAQTVALQNRQQHGKKLLDQYESALQERDSAPSTPITEETGIYLELRGFPSQTLPLASLDSIRHYRLQSMHIENGAEIAVIFVPDSSRSELSKKITAYLTPEKDRSTKEGTKPANHNLINSIAEIRLAHIRSFWTDAASDFPKDPHEMQWWEVWLSKNKDLDLRATAQVFAQRIGAQLGNTALTFHQSTVVLIRASVTQLEQATELISCLAELRRAKDTPSVLINASPKEQREWVDNLLQRIDVPSHPNVYVSILDTGINYDHPLLAPVCSASLSSCWDNAWRAYSVSSPSMHHGSEQAGLALFGNLLPSLLTDERISLPYKIESGRILPPTGNNNPELYGAVTIETASKLEVARPDARRVFSMAVTASSEREGGQPSSWSSTLDCYCSGALDGQRRLFVVAAGNNRDLQPQSDFWDQSALSEIEDPAQAWNALTVGAYTELSTVDESSFDGWSPLASPGDLNPRSRTSLQWSWRKQAPLKPDVVEEGGNVLLSPNHREISDADCVSLLTTSGYSTGKLFTATGATSAATALVSRQLATLCAWYPELWPETHRALLVHSAEWTQRMYERKGELERSHSNKVAGENMLRTFGFGVPNLERALHSAKNALTLIAENELQPFKHATDAPLSGIATLNQLHLYELPWPRSALKELDPATELRMKVTLSYFIEPNPSRRGYRDRFAYASHGLRFGVIRPTQTIENFHAQINKLAQYDEYDGPEGAADGWRFGPKLRTRGSIHSDIWIGSAADLAKMNAIAIYPVAGWWKSRLKDGCANKKTRYSLVVSIESPDQELDIYSEVATSLKPLIST